MKEFISRIFKPKASTTVAPTTVIMPENKWLELPEDTWASIIGQLSLVEAARLCEVSSLMKKKVGGSDKSIHNSQWYLRLTLEGRSEFAREKQNDNSLTLFEFFKSNVHFHTVSSQELDQIINQLNDLVRVAKGYNTDSRYDYAALVSSLQPLLESRLVSPDKLRNLFRMHRELKNERAEERYKYISKIVSIFTISYRIGITQKQFYAYLFGALESMVKVRRDFTYSDNMPDLRDILENIEHIARFNISNHAMNRIINFVIKEINESGAEIVNYMSHIKTLLKITKVLVQECSEQDFTQAKANYSALKTEMLELFSTLNSSSCDHIERVYRWTKNAPIVPDELQRSLLIKASFYVEKQPYHKEYDTLLVLESLIKNNDYAQLEEHVTKMEEDYKQRLEEIKACYPQNS